MQIITKKSKPKNTLYHITPEKNIDSILCHGLIPYGDNIRRGISSRSWGKFVFLTDKVSYIVENQAGDKWMKENKAKILEVDVTNLDLLRLVHCTIEKSFARHEFLSDKCIEPNRIISVKDYVNH